MQAVEDCARHPVALICELVQGFTGAAALVCFEQCEYCVFPASTRVAFGRFVVVPLRPPAV
eukprot:1562586-Pleurochrysis_carterae.AAC.1